MNTEQLAVGISGLAVLISGIVAIWSARISARSSRDNTRQTMEAQERITGWTLQTQTDTTKLTLDHNRQLAREARLWERVAESYVELLEVVWRFMATVDETYPVIGDGDRGNPPDPPSSVEMMTLMARVAAFGSKPVYATLEAWWGTRLTFDHAVWELHTVKTRPEGVDARTVFDLTEAQHYKKVNDARATSHDSVRELQDAINDELRG